MAFRRTGCAAVAVLIAMASACASDDSSDQVAALEAKVADLEKRLEREQLASTTTTERTTTTRAPTTTTPPTTSPPTTTTPTATTARRPNGTLSLNTSPRDGYGQSPYGGPCTSWYGSLANLADTGATEITVTAPVAQWRNDEYGEGAKEWPARALPVVLDLYLAPGQQVDVRFRICTDTPQPEGATTFSTRAQLNLSWKWS